ncbi:GCC2 and GCC3 family protein (macronuclear) [Tetrahymena thermophila SB210]|uniref:GCC2 and GCC3 family protein n=1 Tax=Tetrahymena thermophila (strain SB210) TaxID=312017 RepID=Q22E81_TETTS|nr:GCC2 and GCC3 family protein [Tetrahymena thermophila SB210]EAR83647.2 GCC2 and GCC3 family protein [Tetrahymena thermophila SB210]|eukprot:XP_001031310.2 GCC2 and GCC3 family protein [Tetrahymena thermophila SB210]
MKKVSICLVLFALFQVSFQYCHYSTMPNFLQRGNCLCLGGFYSSSANCEICPNNGFTTNIAYSISDCKGCSSTLYYMSQAATSSTGSVCLQCPNNSQVQSNTPSNPQDISDCMQCQPGYYLQTPAVPPQNGNPGQAAVCIQCPNNTKGINASSVSECNLCNQGFYVSQRATDSQPAICSPCPNNSSNIYDQHYSYQYNVNDCGACLPGYYNTNIFDGQQAICVQCPPNTFFYGTVAKTINSCSCMKNYYMTVASTSTSAPTCLPCPNGSGNYQISILAGDQSQCDICQAGYYMITPNQDPANGNPGTAAQCQQCPNNSTSDPGTSTLVSSCNKCQLNFYMQTAPTPTTSAICQPCPNNSGTLNPVTQQGDATQCSICVAGYYMTKAFQAGQTASCQKCPPGSNTIQGNYSTCNCYDQNATWSSNTNSCQCNQGYIGTPATSIGAQGCTPCPAGKYYQSGSCVDCQAGYYSSSPASLSCTQCTAGNYAQGTGNKACTSCPYNTTPLADFSGCKCPDTSAVFKNNRCVCPDGYQGNPSGLSSYQGCSPCQKGQYSNSSTSGACTRCAAGYFAASTGSSQCQQCGSGQFASDTGNTSCQTCGSGKTNTPDFSDCQCIPNSKLNGDSCVCNPGYIGISANSNSCTACPAGQFTDLPSGKCSPCPSGTYSNGSANVNCTQCSSGQYANGTGNTACSNCGPGSTNSEDFIGCKCYDSNAVTWSVDKNQCQCAANFYGDASQTTSASKTQCIKCPNNTTSKAGAAKTQKDCQSSSTQSSQNSQQNSLYTYSQIIQISILVLVLPI